jgi:hypothetical protein
MKPIDLAVKIINNNADELWQETYDPENNLAYTKGASIADALAQFVYVVEENCDRLDYQEFKRAWAKNF